MFHYHAELHFACIFYYEKYSAESEHRCCFKVNKGQNNLELQSSVSWDLIYYGCFPLNLELFSTC